MDGEFISKKNNAGSIVWRLFGYKREDVEQITIICKVCRKGVATKGGSTKNVYHHLRIHLLEIEECLKLWPQWVWLKSPDSESSSTHLTQDIIYLVADILQRQRYLSCQLTNHFSTTFIQKKPKQKLWTFHFHHLNSYYAANFHFTVFWNDLCDILHKSACISFKIWYWHYAQNVHFYLVLFEILLVTSCTKRHFSLCICLNIVLALCTKCAL